MTNISDFCYEFLNQNLDFFDDLKKYDKDISIDTSNLEHYIHCNNNYSPFFSLMKQILEQVRYISCDEFINITNSNIDEICELINDDYEPVLIMTDANINKSNFYYNFYLLYHLKKRHIIIKYIYSNLYDLFDYEDIKNTIKCKISKKIIFIICDDVSYSGQQLAEHLTTGGEINLHNKNKIFLNIIALLPTAIETIKMFFQDIERDLIIPKKVILIKDTDSCSSIERCLINIFGKNYRNDLNLMDCYVLNKGKAIGEIFITKLFDDMTFGPDYVSRNSINISLVYLFQKYPDRL